MTIAAFYSVDLKLTIFLMQFGLLLPHSQCVEFGHIVHQFLLKSAMWEVHEQITSIICCASLFTFMILATLYSVIQNLLFGFSLVCSLGDYCLGVFVFSWVMSGVSLFEKLSCTNLWCLNILLGKYMSSQCEFSVVHQQRD